MKRKGSAMKSNATTTVLVLKRLKAAVGYHELGMTRHALRCLDSLTSLGKIGPFGLIEEVLRGEFTQNRENHITAAKALETAGFMLPKTARDAVDMTLLACYGHGNDVRRPANSVACAHGAKPAGQPRPAC